MKIRVLLLLSLFATLCGWASESARLLILHTNDLHDHVRAGSNGLGGLPYVAGYVHQVRAERGDVILVDAGDVTEKGDLVAFCTHGEMTFEAMRRIGYDGVTIGNHDIDDIPREQVRRYEKMLGQPLLNLNVVLPDGRPEFTPSRIVERGGVKVGLIGMIVPRKPEEGGLDFAASGRALSEEARRLLDQGAELLIAVCHESVPKCAEWSRVAPEINVFVSGHSHQALAKPVVVAETGAIIVQAGSYARWVGRLEVEFDRAKRRVMNHTGELVPMRHDAVTPDAAMLAWVQEREQALAPDAATFVFDNPKEIDGFTVGRLGADALRVASGADVAFCHPYQVIRNVLPAGRIDVNALFKTGGHRAYHNIEVELTGTEILAYMNAMLLVQREPPEWAGFRAALRPAPGGGERYVAELDPARRYRVLMPKLEWETRFLRLADNLRRKEPQHPLALARPEVRPSAVTFTDALHAYLRAIVNRGETVQAHATALVRARETLANP